MGWGTSQCTGEGKSLLLIPVILLLHIKADFKKKLCIADADAIACGRYKWWRREELEDDFHAFFLPERVQ
jgi:hypothetical protein